ncbi:MAG: hypothetical protein IJT97_03210 [Bacteroidaceae bacterium]|nr:hypothetical protein [Bacteroidaceae bacterium]
MATQNEHQNDAKAQLLIQTRIPFWNLLVQGIKKSNKLSRTEAFFDLIDRQRVTLLKNEGEYLKGSILEFAKAWGWDRDTVARFLDNLEQLGMLTIDMVGNRKFFKLNYAIEKENAPGISQKPSGPLSPSSATDST